MPKHKGWWASALNGARDAGIEIKAGEETAQKPEKTSGKHIEMLAAAPGKKGQQFSKTKDINQITKTFEEIKQKILKAKQAGD